MTPAKTDGTVSAFVWEGDRVHRIDPAGAKVPKQIVTELATGSYCSADARANAIWLLNRAGIAVFDLQAKRLDKLVVANKDVEIEAFEARFDDKWAKVGNASGLEDCNAVVITAGDKPSISVEIIAEGDRAEYCFEPSGKVLQKEYAEQKASYEKLALAENSALSALAARRRSSAWVPQPKPADRPTPKIELDKSKCSEEPSDCGTGEHIGNGYWSIVVGNSRGDFYHEVRGLYDENKAEFVNIDTGKRSNDPTDAPLEAAFIAPDNSSIMSARGGWYSLSQHRLLNPGGDGVIPCGLIDASNASSR